MKHATETGYAHNVTKFSVLINDCESFGAKYNPSRPHLMLDAMRATLDLANRTLEAFKQMVLEYSGARSLRKTRFLLIDKRIRQVNSAFKLAPVSQLDKDHMVSLCKRIHGIPLNPPEKD